MPKRAKELRAPEINRLKTGVHAVGGAPGLLMVVRQSKAKGAKEGELVKTWVLRYSTGETRISQEGNTFAARRDFGLGAFPEVTLKQARESAKEARALLRKGIDPVIQKREARAALVASQTKRLTFEEAARQCHAAKAPEFKSVKHSLNWLATLKNHAFPVIGAIQVSEIDVHHILNVLQPIWTEKTETATRVRQRMEATLAWATVSNFRTGDNPARLQDNLDVLLPKASKVRKVKHFAALPYQRAGQFMAELRKREGMGARALELAILTAARSGDVRGAEWDEFDLTGKLWTIPGERIKSGKLHRVPLSDDAVKLLRSLPRLSDLVFPAPRGGALSDVTLLATVKRMHDDALAAGGDGWIDPTDGRRIVPHGFRSTFKDWARNCATKYPDEVSELALAHVNSDATRAAYARDELLAQRTNMMTEWAKYCGEPIKPGLVTNLERRA